MTDYPWLCPACKAKVPAGQSTCPRCHCPETASPSVADEHIKAYVASGGAFENSSYHCPKCNHHRCTGGEFRAAGGQTAAMLDVATVKFRYVSCIHCGFTEFYREGMSAAGQLADFMFSR